MQPGPIDPRLITVGVAILIIILIGVALYVHRRKQKTVALRQRFGSEYERTVLEHGSVNKAQAKLEDREARVENLNIRALGATERERFVADWQSVQSHFVDRPKSTVTEADQLISSLMQARGYPLADFDQRAADISVNHPRLMADYRAAHGVAIRADNSGTSTEDLRTAMLQYRTLFDELVEMKTPGEIQSAA
jgi:hypothetical protein